MRMGYDMRVQSRTLTFEIIGHGSRMMVRGRGLLPNDGVPGNCPANRPIPYLLDPSLNPVQ